jgi:hypothetical protein
MRAGDGRRRGIHHHTNQRYAYISTLVSACVRKGKPKGSLTVSDRSTGVCDQPLVPCPSL